MAQSAGDLHRQLVVQAVDQVPNVILDVAHVQVLSAHVTGIKNVEQVGDALDDGFAARQRLVAQVIDVPAISVGGHKGLGDLRQTFFQANVSSHGNTR